MRVFVYWNLHRTCWSIKALEGAVRGRVIGHALELDLANATFKVSEAGRQRVLREGRKNVHAGIVGSLEKWTDVYRNRKEVVPVSQMDQTYGKRILHETVRYNPRKGPTFTNQDGKPIYRAEVVHMLPDRSVYAYGVG